MNPERFPLTWPVGRRRTPVENRVHGTFKVDVAQARDELLRSLALLGATNIVLSTNLPLRRDGLPLAHRSEPADAGVAVYFDRKGRPFVMACDSYVQVKSNLRAVGATVDALRTLERHGTEMLEQAFAGFAALPPKRDVRPWWEVLGVREDATDAEMREAARKLAAVHHPDRGGDVAVMSEINAALAEGLAS